MLKSFFEVGPMSRRELDIVSLILERICDHEYFTQDDFVYVKKLHLKAENLYLDLMNNHNANLLDSSNT